LVSLQKYKKEKTRKKREFEVKWGETKAKIEVPKKFFLVKKKHHVDVNREGKCTELRKKKGGSECAGKGAKEGWSEREEVEPCKTPESHTQSVHSKRSKKEKGKPSDASLPMTGRSITACNVLDLGDRVGGLNRKQKPKSSSKEPVRRGGG